jgi:hypothetical protein
VNKEHAQQILSSLEGSSDFVTSQAPNLIQQLISWKRIQYVSVFSIILLVGILCFRCFLRQPQHQGDDEMVGILVCIPFGVWSGYLTLKVWLAPKVWALEHLTSLID